MDDFDFLWRLVVVAVWIKVINVTSSKRHPGMRHLLYLFTLDLLLPAFLLCLRPQPFDLLLLLLYQVFLLLDLISQPFLTSLVCLQAQTFLP